jgi:hypothetical protein
VKVITPTRLLSEAADVLADVRDDLVVVGAAAIEVALASDARVDVTATRDLDVVLVTPTRDIDAVVPVDRAAVVVSRLESAGLRRSEVDYERAFTWIRGDLKVQLVRPFHPFPKPPARGLPANPVFGMATNPVHQITIAFADAPEQPRLHCANAACLVALKQAAFGRTRASDNTPIERDYHDAHLLLSGVIDELCADLERADHEVRVRVIDAATQLKTGEVATIAAARQMVRLGDAESQRAAEAIVRRSARRAHGLLSEVPNNPGRHNRPT